MEEKVWKVTGQEDTVAAIGKLTTLFLRAAQWKLTLHAHFQNIMQQQKLRATAGA